VCVRWLLDSASLAVDCGGTPCNRQCRCTARRTVDYFQGKERISRRVDRIRPFLPYRIPVSEYEIASQPRWAAHNAETLDLCSDTFERWRPEESKIAGWAGALLSHS
jgi:hypothetical protein